MRCPTCNNLVSIDIWKAITGINNNEGSVIRCSECGTVWMNDNVEKTIEILVMGSRTVSEY